MTCEGNNMIQNTFFFFIVTVLVVLPALALPTDPVTGDWDVTCHVAGFTVPGTMSFKLEGEVVTGTVDTEHTGHGTISNGSWKDGNKLYGEL